MTQQNKQTEKLEMNRIKRINLSFEGFYEEKATKINLSMNELYDIAHALFLAQQEKGWNSENQTCWNIRDKIKEAIDKRKKQRSKKEVKN